MKSLLLIPLIKIQTFLNVLVSKSQGNGRSFSARLTDFSMFIASSFLQQIWQFHIIWPNYKFHQLRFPWNSRGFPLLFTTIWGENSCFRSRTNLTRYHLLARRFLDLPANLERPIFSKKTLSEPIIWESDPNLHEKFLNKKPETKLILHLSIWENTTWIAPTKKAVCKWYVLFNMD